LAKAVCRGNVAPTQGVDIVVETATSYKAIAVKSGPSVFNAQSKRRQNQDFQALKSRLLKLQKHFDAVAGYCYGTKNPRPSDTLVFRELAGQAFWEELTGDARFYIRIMEAMKSRPSVHKAQFNSEWTKAVNRFARDFTRDYCFDDGSINWHTLLEMNSGRRR